MLKSRLIHIFKRKEFYNSAWNVADVIVLPLLMLIATPFFIDRLGPGLYGIWMLVNSLIVSIGIVNFGAGDAAIKFVSKYNAARSDKDVSRIVSAASGLSLLLFAVVVLIGFGISTFVGLINPFGLKPDFNSILSDTVILGAVVFGLKQMEQLALSVFRGFERYDTASILSIISKFLLLTGQVILVAYGFSLIDLFKYNIIITAIVVCADFFVVKSRYNYIKVFPSADKFSVKEIFGFSSWSWLQSVLSIIASQIDRLVVVTLAGPVFLAYYSLASTIGSQIHAVFTAAAGWVFPRVSGKTEKQESISSLYYKMQFIILISGCLVISVLILSGDYLFLWWLGEETYSNSILLIRIFLFYILFNLLSIIPHFSLLGSNRIRLATLFMFISVILTITLMVVFYYITGVNGLAYGKMLSSIISIPAMLIVVQMVLVGKESVPAAIKMYLPALLIFAALYLSNLFSVALTIAAVIILYYFYKSRIRVT